VDGRRPGDVDGRADDGPGVLQPRAGGCGPALQEPLEGVAGEGGCATFRPLEYLLYGRLPERRGALCSPEWLEGGLHAEHQHPGNRRPPIPGKDAAISVRVAQADRCCGHELQDQHQRLCPADRPRSSRAVAALSGDRYR